MSALTAIRKLGNAFRQTIRGDVVTIAGTTYIATVASGRAQAAQSPNGGGWLQVQDLRADILKTLLANPPPANTLVTWQGHDFEFQSYEGDEPASVAWVLRCRRII